MFLSGRWHKPLLTMLCVSLLACLLASCSLANTAPIVKISDLHGRVVGSQEGTVFDELADVAIKRLRHKYYPDLESQLTALADGKVDAILLDEPVGQLLGSTDPRFDMLADRIVPDEYGFAFPKTSTLRAQIEDMILQFERNGTMDELKMRWFSGDPSKVVSPPLDYKKDFTGAGGNIVYATSAQVSPMSFYDDTQTLVGFEVDLAKRLAYELNMTIDIKAVDPSVRITSVEHDLADMAGGCLSITTDRQEIVDFVHYYEGGIVALIRAS